MSRETGGPAFPRPHSVDSRPDGSVEYAQEGMDLRDYFAAKAIGAVGEDIHSIVYHAERFEGDEFTAHLAQAEKAAKVIATAAYMLADAMLKVRGY